MDDDAEGTCFWDAVLVALSKIKNSEGISKNMKVEDFVKFCQKRSKVLLTNRKNIYWNEENIDESEIVKNHIGRMNSLRKHDRIKGYNCGSCDSFLLFLCGYFKVNIYHTITSYDGQRSVVTYKYDKPYEKGGKNTPPEELYFSSSLVHFSYISKKLTKKGKRRKN